MSIRKDLEQRAQAAILASIVESYKKRHADWVKDPKIRSTVWQRAFFDPKNAAIIASTIVSAGCLPLLVLPILALTAPIWLALGALVPVTVGLVVEAIFLYLSIRDEKAHAQAVAEMLQPKVDFEPGKIKDQDLRGKVTKAMDYWRRIDDAVLEVPEGALRDRLATTTREVTNWLQAVYNLARRVDGFHLNDIVKRDLESVPAAIEAYKLKLFDEDDPAVRTQLQKTIADKERQLQTLKTLENNIETAGYQLDSTISSLGTIYSQLLLVGSKDEAGTKINRLQEEISEQVHRLEDLTEAMDEVYRTSV